MTNNNFAPIPPLVPGDNDLEQGTVERDDDVVLDPDINDDLIDSADADRLAADPEADERL